MTNEERQLLLQDLCGRLPYGVKVDVDGKVRSLVGLLQELVSAGYDIYDFEDYELDDVKPYLRPMDSMTEEEREACADFIYKQSNESCWIDEYGSLNLYGGNEFIDAYTFSCYLDWLNEYHFDFRGLIEKSLALPATKDMYK